MSDRQELLPLLDDLAQTVESLVSTGLTTASDATLKKLDVAFREASRQRLLRLSTSLRVANDELSRFLSNADGFSTRRLCFFLNRAWLLSHGISRAIRAGDQAELRRLLWTPETAPIDELTVVTLGVSKKVVPGVFASFEFRLRATSAKGPLEPGAAVVWSVVFPLKPGNAVPPEGFLHLPQKQKFVANVFLKGHEVVIKKAAVSPSGAGFRLSLGDESRVEAGGAFRDFSCFSSWDSAASLRRLDAHETGPLDLEIDLQEEVVLESWSLAKESSERDAQRIYTIETRGVRLEAAVSKGVEGTSLTKALGELGKKKKRPPLFGLLHYERAGLVLQPLSVFTDEGMDQLMISKESIDRAALLKTLRF